MGAVAVEVDVMFVGEAWYSNLISRCRFSQSHCCWYEFGKVEMYFHGLFVCMSVLLFVSLSVCPWGISVNI